MLFALSNHFHFHSFFQAPSLHWLYSLYIEFFWHFAFFSKMPRPDQFPGQCGFSSYPISISMYPQEYKGGGCLINIVSREFGFIMWTVWSGYNYSTLGYQKGRSAPSPNSPGVLSILLHHSQGREPFLSKAAHHVPFLSTCSLPKTSLGAEDTGDITIWLGTYRNRQSKSYMDIPCNKIQSSMGPHTMIS